MRSTPFLDQPGRLGELDPLEPLHGQHAAGGKLGIDLRNVDVRIVRQVLGELLQVPLFAAEVQLAQQRPLKLRRRGLRADSS